MSDLFSRAAHWTGQQCGRASVFMVAVGVIIAWAVTGPFFHYSDTWQLIINTGTTIVTFLMVFLLQNTQNRDTAAIQLKLDELIRANRNARNMMFGLEDLSEEELKKSKRLLHPWRMRLPRPATRELLPNRSVNRLMGKRRDGSRPSSLAAPGPDPDNHPARASRIDAALAHHEDLPAVAQCDAVIGTGSHARALDVMALSSSAGLGREISSWCNERIRRSSISTPRS